MKRYSSGFTLIEVLVTTFIAALLLTGFLGAFIVNLKTIKTTKIRVAAGALAQEKIEQLRNLGYDDLATKHGPIIPQGNIDDEETIDYHSITLTVKAYISYYDDPFDGCAIKVSATSSKCTDGSVVSKSQDLYTYDYKKITIKIFTADQSQVAEASSNVSSHAAETASNTGILSISVINALGQSVPDAEVTVTSTDSSIVPALSLQLQTTSESSTLIPLLKPATKGYHVVATKAGYSTDMSYSPTIQNPNPLNPDPKIIAQQVTQITLTIDSIATLTIQADLDSSAPAGNMVLTLTSTKMIDGSATIPKYILTATADSAGKAIFSNLEWDSYKITSPNGTYLLTSVPYSPVSLSPNQQLTATLKISLDSTKLRLISLSPQQTVANQILTVELTGANLTTDTALAITKDGQTINGSNLTIITSGTEATATMDLTTATSGSWNVVLTKSSGDSLTQINGLVIQ